MWRGKFLIIIVFGLTACQPKGSYIYQNPKTENFPIEQVVVVIDYLNLRDDIGEYWDFDSYYHQKTLDHLFAQVKAQLNEAGYPKINSYLLSSGLLLKDSFAVEHYVQDQPKEGMLYPPYLQAQTNIKDEHIAQHREFLNIMIKYLAQRKHHETDPVSMRGMQMGYHFEEMQLEENTAILYIHINQSAPGIMKTLSTLLLTGAIASQADYAHVGIDLSSHKQASIFWIHKGSGQILWKNHSTSWSTSRPLAQLLTNFPNNH